MKNLIANVLLSGTGASFVLLLLTRLLPNNSIRAASVKIGRFMTGFGRMRLGKSFWEKVEDFIENSIAVCWEGFREGLNSDDEKSS